MIILLKLKNDRTSSSFTDLNKKIKRGFFLLDRRSNRRKVDSSILSVVALNGIVEGMLVAIVLEIQSRYGITQIANSTV